jgi:hypothetical protein
MQEIVELINDATMQAWIWGPLMGVVFGALFAGVTNPPTVNQPVTVIQTTQNFITTKVVVKQQNGGSNNDSGGAVVIMIGLGLGVIFLVWQYAIHFQLIHHYLWVLLSTVLSFSLAAALMSLAKGQFTSSSWSVYIAAPMAILAGCGVLLNLAKASFDPKFTQLASQLKFTDFYMKSLSDSERSLVICQMAGMTLILFVLVCTGIALLHYLALMNQRGYGPLRGFWIFLTRITMFFSGKPWFFLLVGLLALSYLLIEPSLIPTWMAQKQLR